MSEIIKNALFDNATTKLLHNQQNFLKIKDGHDFMTRLASIPLGFVGSCISFVENAFLCVYHALWALLELLTCHRDKAKIDANRSLDYLTETMKSLVSIPLSLLFNPLDLLVGAIKSLASVFESGPQVSINLRR